MLGKTVGQLRVEMTEAEFVEWAVFLGRRQQRQQLAEMQAKARR